MTIMYYSDDDNDDWLKNRYSQYRLTSYWWLISGHKSFSEKIGLTANEKVSLLSIANRDRIYAYLLTIGVDEGKEQEVKDILRLNQFAPRIIKVLEKIFHEKVHVILFRKDNNDEDIDFFSVSNREFSSFTDKNTNELKSYFRQIDNRLLLNPGTRRNINERFIDSFHWWSRIHLTRFISKNVVNIIDIKHSTIIKLRRISKDKDVLEDWEPYLNESASYASTNLICEENDIELRTLVYDKYREDIVVLHDIFDPKKEYIDGKKILLRPESIDVIMNGIDENTEDVRYYRSTKK